MSFLNSDSSIPTRTRFDLWPRLTLKWSIFAFGRIYEILKMWLRVEPKEKMNHEQFETVKKLIDLTPGAGSIRWTVHHGLHLECNDGISIVFTWKPHHKMRKRFVHQKIWIRFVKSFCRNFLIAHFNFKILALVRPSRVSKSIPHNLFLIDSQCQPDASENII